MVLLTKRYALKVPRLSMWREGLAANRSESNRWRESPDPDLCPIKFMLFKEILIVMPRTRPLDDNEFAELTREYIHEGSKTFGRRLSGDFKRENYGMLDGVRLRIDYESGEMPMRMIHW